jgi:hypothetical protein
MADKDFFISYTGADQAWPQQPSLGPAGAG